VAASPPSFPGETEGSLDALRELFRRKAAAVGRVPGPAGDGDGGGDRGAARPTPPGVDARRCVELRGELGLPFGPDDAALVAGDGSPLSADDLPTWLRRARLVSLSLETNGGLCRSLLHVRYGCPDQQEVAA
jgi:hypothetical protein